MTYETELSQRLQDLQNQLAQVTQERDSLDRSKSVYQARIRLLESALARRDSAIVLWHGKFLMLKQENNALRRCRDKKQQEIDELRKSQGGLPAYAIFQNRNPMDHSEEV